MKTPRPSSLAPEIHEASEEIERKVDQLAECIQKSKHFVVFTGAGVSTSAGIPDYRGPSGVWTLRAQGKEPTVTSSVTLQAIPTATHLALVELQNQGILKFLVSQNCDGLHRRSGIQPNKISEIHGNSNLEVCGSCDKEYLRDFRAVAPYDKSIHDHRTGRQCTHCNGKLYDTIINFGEDLPQKAFRNACEHAKKADVLLVLGSSITVTPACEIPRLTGRRRNANLVICNLQETPLDDMAHIRVFTSADDLMTRLMEKLGLTIPPFILRRNLVVEVKAAVNGRHQLVVSGVDSDGTDMLFLRGVKLKNNRRVVRAEPFAFDLRGDVSGTQFELELEFMGHYAEPNLELTHMCEGGGVGRYMYFLEFSFGSGTWTTTRGAASASKPRSAADFIIIDD